MHLIIISRFYIFILIHILLKSIKLFLISVLNFQLPFSHTHFFYYFSTLNMYFTESLGNLYILIALFTPPATFFNASSASTPYFFFKIYPPALKAPFLTSSPASTNPSYKLINTFTPVTTPPLISFTTFCSYKFFTPLLCSAASRATCLPYPISFFTEPEAKSNTFVVN